MNKTEIAIERIKTFETPEGYWLAFSGGKDSMVIYRLAEMAGVKFDAHFSLTSVDPPEVVRFVRENYPSVSIEIPPKSMWQLIVDNGMPPTRLKRYCCKELKERGGVGRLVMTGIRSDESWQRSHRTMVESCYKVSKMFLHPIIDWTEQEVWDFIRQEGLKYCCLYDEGQDRIGCIMCPFSGKKKRVADAIRWPKYYHSYLRAFQRMLDRLWARGRETTWKTPEDVMKWWIEVKELPKL